MPKTKAKTIQDFANQTSLVPIVVLDCVVDEVCNHLIGSEDTEELYETLRGPVSVKAMEDEILSLYRTDEVFRSSVSRPGGRPGLYAFVRRWVAGEMKKGFAEQYRKLPARFSAGHPI